MPEPLYYLALVSVLTTLLWVPIGVHLMLEQGVGAALGNRHDLAPFAPWAERARRAHANAVENLVVFAALVLIANAAGISNDTTVLACQVYFWTRLVHFLSYTFAVPWVRTVSFAVGFGCQIAIVLQLI